MKHNFDWETDRDVAFCRNEPCELKFTGPALATMGLERLIDLPDRLPFEFKNCPWTGRLLGNGEGEVQEEKAEQGIKQLREGTV